MRSFIIEFNELDDNELQVVFKVKKDLIYQSLLLNMIQAMADIAELARSYYGADLEEEYDYEGKEDFVTISTKYWFPSEEDRKEFEQDICISFF
mgnify:FL=1